MEWFLNKKLGRYLSTPTFKMAANPQKHLDGLTNDPCALDLQNLWDDSQDFWEPVPSIAVAVVLRGLQTVVLKKQLRTFYSLVYLGVDFTASVKMHLSMKVIVRKEL
ncbi:unnamed protein product [Callosobruchus maculatus]|uniref:Uncharacterized protein n=1 Tax=Callosobruchus maculatus TaxID=64391 RepID=A0A653C5X2_CALMS|nr:unnamed protein product [Callosobruchus maculatus]